MSRIENPKPQQKSTSEGLKSGPVYGYKYHGPGHGQGGPGEASMLV